MAGYRPFGAQILDQTNIFDSLADRQYREDQDKVGSVDRLPCVAGFVETGSRRFRHRLLQAPRCGPHDHVQQTHQSNWRTLPADFDLPVRADELFIRRPRQQFRKKTGLIPKRSESDKMFQSQCAISRCVACQRRQGPKDHLTYCRKLTHIFGECWSKKRWR